MRTARAATLARACHPGPCLAVSGIAAALARATGRPPAEVAGVAAAVLSGQLAVGWHNDWLDADRDRAAGRAGKPLVARPDLRPMVAAAGAGALLCCVPLSAQSGPRAAVAHLSGVALALGYNAGIKSTAWSWTPYAGSFALLVGFVGLGRPDRRPPAWWAVLAGASLGVGAHFANVVPDLDHDAVTGVRGLPNRLGRGRSTATAAGLVAAASALLALAPKHLDRTVLVVPAALGLLSAGAVAERRRPGALFASTIAVAILDAGLLAGRGGDL